MGRTRSDLENDIDFAGIMLLLQWHAHPLCHRLHLFLSDIFGQQTSSIQILSEIFDPESIAANNCDADVQHMHMSALTFWLFHVNKPFPVPRQGRSHK